jgi:hypothetical protein
LIIQRLQKHIREAIGKVIKPDNSKKIFIDKNKMRNRALNAMKLANGEEIVTKNFGEINKNVVKAEVDVITLRNMIEQSQVLYRTIFDPENVKSEKFRAILDNDYNAKRLSRFDF